MGPLLEFARVHWQTKGWVEITDRNARDSRSSVNCRELLAKTFLSSRGVHGFWNESASLNDLVAEQCMRRLGEVSDVRETIDPEQCEVLLGQHLVHGQPWMWILKFWSNFLKGLYLAKRREPHSPSHGVNECIHCHYDETEMSQSCLFLIRRL